MPQIENRNSRASASAQRLPSWPARWMLRRCELSDLPEVRHLVRITWHRAFTLGAAPNQQKMRAIREQALSALIREQLDRSGAPDANQTSAEPSCADHDGSAPAILISLRSPPDIREAVQAYVRSASLPPPKSLAEYTEHIPGTAEHILCRAERSVTYKIYIEDKLASGEIETAKMGQLVALDLNLLAFAVSAASFALKYQVAGTVFAIFPAALLIASLISAEAMARKAAPHNDYVGTPSIVHEPSAPQRQREPKLPSTTAPDGQACP